MQGKIKIMVKFIEKIKKLCYHLIERKKETKMRRERKDREDDVMNAITLSNYIIEKFNEQGAPITNLKLQKVLYYVQGYSLKYFGKPAFQEEIYSWQYGPVVPMSYYEYNRSGAHGLVPNNNGMASPEPQLNLLITSIVDACKPIPPSALVAKTHDEDPWKYTFLGEIITKQKISSYFSRNNPLEIKQ